jgi:thiamine-phosphate pyrophosphorylase
MHSNMDLRLYVILDPTFTAGRPLPEVAAAAIAGGATMLQVRAKQVTTRQLLRVVEEVLAVARPAGVPVIVNDRADVAFAAGAAGVHVGEDDLPVGCARRLLGPAAIVGFSSARLDLIHEAERDGADYLGVGDVFGTTSKADADAPIGVAGLRAVLAATSLPVVAIGGIRADNAGEAVRAGAIGVAVISAVAAAPDVTAAARALRDVVDKAGSA